MKLLAIILLALTLSTAHAWEKAAYVAGASVIYAGYDVLVYSPNQWPAGSTEEVLFRVSQIALLGGLTWFLVDRFGWKTGVSFGVLYFTWNLDALYYLMYGKRAWYLEVEKSKYKNPAGVPWTRHTLAGQFEWPTSPETLKYQMGAGMIVATFFIVI